MSTLIMMMIAGTFVGGMTNAINHYDEKTGKVVFEKSKEYKPEKSNEKPTIFGCEIEPVKLKE